MRKALLSLVLFASCAFGVAAAQPAPRIDREAVQAEARTRAAQMADQLALTPDQRSRAAPVIRNSLLRRWSALTSAWADGVFDDTERARLEDQFEVERRGVVATLNDVLSDEQLETFRTLQAEETARFQEELRQGRFNRKQ